MAEVGFTPQYSSILQQALYSSILEEAQYGNTGMSTFGNKDLGPTWDPDVAGTAPQQTVIGGKDAEGVNNSTVFTTSEELLVTEMGMVGRQASNPSQGETIDWKVAIYNWNGSTATTLVGGAIASVTTTNQTGTAATNYEAVVASVSFLLPAGDYTLAVANVEADGGDQGNLGCSSLLSSPSNCTNAVPDNGNAPESTYTGANVRDSQPAIWITAIVPPTGATILKTPNFLTAPLFL